VTFHRLQGVERFWLYDNLSTDDWQSELAPELASGVVTVQPWSHKRPQETAYTDCLQRHRGGARWLAFIDIDEFLFSPTGLALPDVLSRFDTRPGVAVNWRLFGTSGHEEPPPGLAIESFLWRAIDAHRGNRFVKSIIYPRMTVGVLDGPHFFHHRGLAVGEDGGEHWGPWRDPPTAELLRINHYTTKSKSEWERKLRRPNAHDGQIPQNAVLPGDDVRDETILQFLPALKEALDQRSSELGHSNHESPAVTTPRDAGRSQA
jgi:hypothetical protein